MLILWNNIQTITELVSVTIVALLRNSLLIGPVIANKLILIGSRHETNINPVFIIIFLIVHLNIRRVPAIKCARDIRISITGDVGSIKPKSNNNRFRIHWWLIVIIDKTEGPMKTSTFNIDRHYSCVYGIQGVGNRLRSLRRTTKLAAVISFCKT